MIKKAWIIWYNIFRNCFPPTICQTDVIEIWEQEGHMPTLSTVSYLSSLKLSQIYSDFMRQLQNILFKKHFHFSWIHNFFIYESCHAFVCKYCLPLMSHFLKVKGMCFTTGMSFSWKAIWNQTVISIHHTTLKESF